MDKRSKAILYIKARMDILENRKGLVKEINSSNSISFELSQTLLNLNHYINEYLSFLFLQLDQSKEDGTDPNISILRNCFQDIYSFLRVDKGDIQLMINYRRLSRIVEQLKRLKMPIETSLQDSEYERATNTIYNLINIYISIFVYSKRSNFLILSTLEYRNLLNYWNSIDNSVLNKVIYAVQVVPIKLYELINTIIGNFAVHSKEVLLLGIPQKLDLLWQSAKNTLGKLASDIPSLSMYKIGEKNWRSYYMLFQTPVNLITREISMKKKFLKRVINQNYEEIGRIIETIPREIPHDLSVSFDRLPYFQLLKQLDENVTLEELPEWFIERLNEDIQINNTKPSFLTRYWPIVYAVVVYGPSKSINIYKNREAILRSLKVNFVDIIIGFFKNWVVEPVRKMLGVLRRDDSADDFSIISKDSLRSDLDSLERMVVSYSADFNLGDDSLTEKEAHDLVLRGDMSLLMSGYETDIKKPYKALLKGSLLRAILIQIQKAKVDGEVAISGIDKMLKSQQLVFGVVSISPSLLILYLLYQLLLSRSERPLVINGKQLNLMCLKSLNRIEKLLTFASGSRNVGKLFIEVINLQLYSRWLLPKTLEEDLLLDLHQLNNPKETTERKKFVMNRVWNTYSHYFR